LDKTACPSFLQYLQGSLGLFKSGLFSLLAVDALSTTLGILLGQLEAKCCSDWQIQHVLLVSYTCTVDGIVDIAISLTFRVTAVLDCGATAVLYCGAPAV